MNAVVNHIMQTVDWTRFSLEEWLYQFGAWMHSNSGTCGKSINPIATAMDVAAKEVKQKKLSILTEKDIIAGYFCGEIEPNLSLKRPQSVCQITDNEARAVQRLILDMQGKSHVLDEWLDAVINRYFYNNSWSEMVVTRMNAVGEMIVIYSQNDARSDVKCGLAALHSRYSFIPYK